MNFKLLKTALAVAAVMSCDVAASAKDYFVGPEANLGYGWELKYRDKVFNAGFTAFTDIESVLAILEENSKIFFSSQTLGSFTISKSNVELIGANAWCDGWSGARNTDAETNVTGEITVNASGVTINGFCFTGNGCVRNDDAQRGSSIDNFSYIYNRCTGSTLTSANEIALLYLGHAYRPNSSITGLTDPTVAASAGRYDNVYVAHNTFEGAAAESQPNCIQVAGSTGSTVVTDNHFEYGGTSISLFNTQGDFEVSHNNFKNVGEGAAKGQFCLRLYYVGCIDASGEYATGHVKDNMFDGCIGQSSMWSLIRFYNGDKNEDIYKPVNTKLYVNYNTFKNKTCKRDDGFNYVLYANNTNTTTADVDVRWNSHDNTEMCYAWVKPSWETKGQRYFAGSQNRFNYPKGNGTTVGIYGSKDADGNVLFGRATPKDDAAGLKEWTFGKSSVAGRVATQVVQSCDIDDSTGDVYIAIDHNTTNKFGSAVKSAIGITSDKFLFMTRVASGGAETHMYFSNCGHGSNMAITRYNGKVYVVTGAPSVSSTSTTPSGIGFIPWEAGKHVDLGTSTGYMKLNKDYCASNGSTYPYPSVDNDNRLLVVRSRTSSGDYFSVYDLDEALANPETVTYKKQVFVQKGARKITNSARECLNTLDTGFKTWSDQGFTISGDYIYTLEGDSKNGYGDNPVPTDGLPVYIQNLINWRTGEYVSRSAIRAKEILEDMSQGDDEGEPESMKVHRDDKGRPSLLVGCITGATGARKFSLFSYKLKQENGQGDALAIDDYGFSADRTSMSLSTNDAPASSVVNVTLSGMATEVTAAIVGADGESFAVSRTGNSFTVTFTPDRWKTVYNAALRLSSPNAADIMIPLTGNYGGEVTTGVENVVTTEADVVTGECRVFDLSGRAKKEPSRGVNIVSYPDGRVEKVMIVK